MALRTQNLSDTQWEIVLPNVLHYIRSLLSTDTNTPPMKDSSDSRVAPHVDSLYLPGCPPKIM